ncbi:translation initiation factor IF-2-like isoform X1 [Myiozetetes cayanensis]|uniref:translation initiation factor IF-2-like isoform X1 n=1 Tax=Myiozetetes cayanensis TaxID=478635 RepID=UPI002160D0FF|nr:translation initiation factor IF-2-like isoform X1 [Myiozetetes cayanensis]
MGSGARWAPGPAHLPPARPAGAVPGRSLGPRRAGPLGPGLCRGPGPGERRRFPRPSSWGRAGPAPGPPELAGPPAPPAPPRGVRAPPARAPPAPAHPPRREHRPPAPSPRPQCRGLPARSAPGNGGSGARRGSGHGPAPAVGSRGPCRGREERFLSSFLPCSGTPSGAARLSPCPCVCPQAAPGAGADRAAARAQAGPASAFATAAISHSDSLACDPEAAAHLTAARRARSCLAGKGLQERKPTNAPSGRCGASHRRFSRLGAARNSGQ